MGKAGTIRVAIKSEEETQEEEKTDHKEEIMKDRAVSEVDRSFDTIVGSLGIFHLSAL